MATKTRVQVSENFDSASDTTDDESLDEEDVEMEANSPVDVKEESTDNDSQDESKGDEDGGSEEEVAEDEVLSSASGDDNSDDGDEATSGLANVMAKILNKKAPEKKSAILVKAKTDREIQWKKRQSELESEASEVKKIKTDDGDVEVKEEKDTTPSINSFQKEKERHVKHKQWEELGHVKPHVLERETERRLQKIATKGVVQLFNAVKKQQKGLDDKLKEAGSSINKRERIMKNVSKGDFLDMLKGSANGAAEPLAEKKSKKTKEASLVQKEEDGKPTWGVLRDDFMMGAKMKDWDRDSEEEESDGEIPQSSEEESS